MFNDQTGDTSYELLYSSGDQEELSNYLNNELQKQTITELYTRNYRKWLKVIQIYLCIYLRLGVFWLVYLFNFLKKRTCITRVSITFRRKTPLIALGFRDIHVSIEPTRTSNFHSIQATFHN